MTLGSSTIKTAESEWQLVDGKRPVAVEFNSDFPSICVPTYQPVNRIVWNVGARVLVDTIQSPTPSVRFRVDVVLV